MVFECKCKFLGIEEKQSKKGNNYFVVSVIQGVETLTCMSDVEINAEFGKDFIGLLDYNPQYKSLKLIGLK